MKLSGIQTYISLGQASSASVQEASRLVDRILSLRNGQLAMQQMNQQLLTHPVYAADFRVLEEGIPRLSTIADNLRNGVAPTSDEWRFLVVMEDIAEGLSKLAGDILGTDQKDSGVSWSLLIPIVGAAFLGGLLVQRATKLL